MANFNSLPSAPQSFPNSIAEKLDDSNYLHWKQQIKPVIKSHRLHRDAEIVNPAYETWEVQDPMLLTIRLPITQVYEGRTHGKYKRKPEQQPKQPEPGLGN